MEQRYAVNPRDFKKYATEKIRENFLVRDIFVPGNLKLVYCFDDRIVIGGICPLKEAVELKGSKEIGADFFLERREMGIINLGGKGKVITENAEYELDKKDGLYLGMGTKK